MLATILGLAIVTLCVVFFAVLWILDAIIELYLKISGRFKRPF
jgi:hypothetical protein